MPGRGLVVATLVDANVPYRILCKTPGTGRASAVLEESAGDYVIDA